MQKTLLTTLIFALLVLFIFSPFAALAGLMIVLFITATIFFLNNILQVILGTNTSERKSSEDSFQ